MILYASLIFILLGSIVPYADAATWWDSDWLYHKQITIDSSQVDATLTDFPVLVRVTDTDISANAQADCDDILFTNDNHDIQYDHEIEDCDLAGSDTLTAWVKVPSVSDTADTDFFVYYGNALAANQEDVEGVWSNGYFGVWHLNDDLLDSTSNNLDGTNNGSSDGTGYISDAQDFDGVNDHITVPTMTHGIGTGDFTMSAWVEPDVLSGWQGIFAQPNYNPSFNAHGAGATSNWGYFDGGASESGNDLVINTWYYLSVSRDSGTLRFYEDGISTGTTVTETDSIGNSSGMIGANHPTSNEFDGLIDEVRFSTVERLPAWVDAEYNNQVSTSTFLSYGSEQTEPASGPTINVSDGIEIGDTIELIQTHTVNLSDGTLFGDSIQTSLDLLIDLNVGDGIQVGDTIQLSVQLPIDLQVSDGIILGDSTSTDVSRLVLSGVSDGIIFDDSFNILVTSPLTIAVSDGIEIGDTIAENANFLIAINEGILLGDTVQAILFGDIPLNLSDGILIGDGQDIAIGCDVTCTMSLSDGIHTGDTPLGITVQVATFNSIKLYLNTPTLDRLGGVFAQSCDVGEYVSGVDNTGTIICTLLP